MCGLGVVALEQRLRLIAHQLRKTDKIAWALSIWREIARQMRRQGWHGISNSPIDKAAIERSLIEVDHIQARADGGTHRLDNLRSLCQPCHKRRTAKQNVERRTSKKRKRDREWRRKKDKGGWKKKNAKGSD